MFCLTYIVKSVIMLYNVYFNYTLGSDCYEINHRRTEILLGGGAFYIFSFLSIHSAALACHCCGSSSVSLRIGLVGNE